MAASALPVPKGASADQPAKLTVRVEAPESDVLNAVQQVSQDQIIHGTYSYEKERILYGAHSANSAKVFGAWQGSGKVFYKVANNIVSPRFFKDSEDVGTVSVRYVVREADANATILQIDAMFVDARNVHHPSLGNVESSEYAAILEHLRKIQSQRQQVMQGMATAGPDTSQPTPGKPSGTWQPSAANAAATAPPVTVPELQGHIEALRHEVELRVKDPGAQVRAAPFHSAAALETLPSETEVLIVVVTPYWYGIETEDGHHGWVHHSQLEPLP